LPPHKLALRLCDESQITVKCALLPVSRGFTARRTGSGLRFLVQQLDECVVALFKFGRFDRLHGEPEEGESRFRLPFLDIQAQGRPKQQRELHRRRGVSNAPAPTIAVSSKEGNSDFMSSGPCSSNILADHAGCPSAEVHGSPLQIGGLPP